VPSHVVDCAGRVDVLTAVHVASALVDDADAGTGAPSALDAAYLGALGCRERLDDWRAIARELLDRTEEHR
ncbi:MAG TPA: hypothetical protein VF048_08040, partial [Gemmatimonadaceae bacterium]